MLYKRNDAGLAKYKFHQINGKTPIKQPNKSIGEFRCFNNNKIDITGTIQVDITSGSSYAKNCTILLVNNKTINIMGRDIMNQLGLRPTMKTTKKVRKIYSIFRTCTNEYPNGYSTNTHTYAQDWEGQKTTWQNQLLKKSSAPTQRTKNSTTFDRKS